MIDFAVVKRKRHSRMVGRPWLRLDLAGRRFGDLRALYPVRYVPQLGWVWAMRCVRLKEDGTQCGRIRFMYARRRNKTVACAACSGQGRDEVRDVEVARIGQGKSRRRRATKSNYKELRATFTADERDSYREYLGNRPTKGKRGERNQIEAVDLVMMERDRRGN